MFQASQSTSTVLKQYWHSSESLHWHCTGTDYTLSGYDSLQTVLPHNTAKLHVDSRLTAAHSDMQGRNITRDYYSLLVSTKMPRRPMSAYLRYG